MVAAHLVVGTAVGRSNVKALAGETFALPADAEGDPDEPAGTGQRAREERSGNVHVDRAVMEIKVRHKRERVHVGATVWAGQADFQRVAAAVGDGLHRHMSGPHRRSVIQRQVNTVCKRWRR